MSTLSSGSKRLRSPSITPKGKKAKSFTGFAPQTSPILIPFDFRMEVNNTPASLSPSSSPFLSPRISTTPDLARGSPKEFTREWSNVLKDIAVISSDRVVDPASIMGQVVPIFMRLSRFIFSSVTSPIPVVESEGRHLARKLFYFASENYAQVDGAFSIVNEENLNHTITQAVDHSNADLSIKMDNISNQFSSIQRAFIELSNKVSHFETSPKSSTPPSITPSIKKNLPKTAQTFSSAVKKLPNPPSATIKEVSSPPETEFQTVSYKKRDKKIQSSSIPNKTPFVSLYTQICIYPEVKLRRGISDIASKVTAINKSIPLDKAPKGFYCVMGRVTAQGNIVFSFPDTFSFELILGFKNLILNALSLPLSTVISHVLSEHGYYVTGIPISHPVKGSKLSEDDLLSELRTNNPDIPITRVVILPPSNNPKFANSQLGSANFFISSKNADMADKIIFNMNPFLIFHSPCRVQRKREKKDFIFCSRCFKIGSHETSQCKLKVALCKFCTSPSGSSSQHNTHCALCINDGNLGTECIHPPTCRNCLGPHAFDFPLCPLWSKFKLHGNLLAKYQSTIRNSRIDDE
ncbi:hypothetical protein PNOK_0150200 [Pyrrhoderma noxium]|uniref:Uncharacterized protein n=1 Tax=Pyrrhoderma noxium TaxID=2282107 RepID=A0A286UPZ3_9AGAM|nr:hypothetical protein PNOK_0150200 [Pyrrhoderma noxium]